MAGSSTALVCCSSILIAACAHVRTTRCAARERIPPAARTTDRPLRPDPVLRVAQGDDGDLFLLVPHGLVRLDGEIAMVYPGCSPAAYPPVFFPLSEGAAWVGGVCDFSVGGRVEMMPGTASANAQTGELLAGEFSGSDLHVIQPYSERTIRFPVEIHSAVLGHGAALVRSGQGLSVRDDALWIASLDDDRPVVHLPVPLDPDTHHHPWLRRAQWRGESILLTGAGDHQFMVFRVDDLGEPTLWIRNTRLRIPVAALSPDGEQVVSEARGGRVARYDTRDGTELWRTTNYRAGPVRELRWAPDGRSVVARYDDLVERLHVGSRDTISFQWLDPTSVVAISPNATAIAECRSGLPGEEDVLFISPLHFEDVHFWDEGAPPPRFRSREWDSSDRSGVQLPEQSCVQAQVGWLDDETIAVFNNRLHLVRGDRLVLSVAVEESRAEGETRWRVQRDERPPEPMRVISPDARTHRGPPELP